MPPALRHRQRAKDKGAYRHINAKVRQPVYDALAALAAANRTNLSWELELMLERGIARPDPWAALSRAAVCSECESPLEDGGAPHP